MQGSTGRVTQLVDLVVDRQHVSYNTDWICNGLNTRATHKKNSQDNIQQLMSIQKGRKSKELMDERTDKEENCLGTKHKVYFTKNGFSARSKYLGSKTRLSFVGQSNSDYSTSICDS